MLEFLNQHRTVNYRLVSLKFYHQNKQIFMLPVPPKSELENANSAPEVVPTVDDSAAELPGVPESNDADNADKVQAIVNQTKSWGSWIFSKLEAAGEFVASILGLDDSRYQWVIDNMSEEDWKVARKVQAQREAQAAGRPFEDMEGGEAEAEKLPPAPPQVSVSMEVENRS